MIGLSSQLEKLKTEEINVTDMVRELMHLPMSESKINDLKNKGIILEDKYYIGMLDTVLNQLKNANSIKGIKAFENIIGIYRETESIIVENNFNIPAHMLARSWVDFYRLVRDNEYQEYLLSGGRGSLKSSTIPMVSIEQLINNPDTHILVVRKLSNTLRDSVFAQYKWAINQLGLENKFKATVSPMQIVYEPTGQTIYFRGGDEPEKIKSIKPEFGYIAYLWFEEVDQFNGPEDIRNIEQSALRGGPIAVRFKSYNAPKSQHHWINNYALLPKPNMYVHHTTYLDVPKKWLGQPFVDEAELLRELNETAYKHEYLGEIVGQGYNVFDNIVAQEFSDDIIERFEYVYHGQDWGWFPDPNRFVGMSYDANTRNLYIFREENGVKMNSDEWAYKINDMIDKGYTIIADSNERKSIGDLRDMGFNIREAIKGPNSVHEGFKWLSGLNNIFIDPVRCPLTYKEFINYEYEKDKEGNAVTAYPDRDNHSLAAVRYAMEIVWKKRGL